MMDAEKDGQMPRRADRDQGYITLAVLVFAGLLAAIVSTLLIVSLPTLGYARIGAQEISAEGLLDAGLNFGAYSLFTAKRDAASVNGTALRLGSSEVRIAVTDEAARVDLNAADAELLAGLYAAAGGRALSPAMFAARVIDWRDEDDEETGGGAEIGRYASEGSAYAPRNGRFRTTADLGFVLGVGREELARLEPFTTVFNPDGGIDPIGASDVVLSAIPDLSPSDLEILVESRRAGVTDRSAVLEAMRSPSRFFQTDPSGIYRIQMRARLTNDFISAADAVVIRSPDETKDFSVLAWSKVYP